MSAPSSELDAQRIKYFENQLAAADKRAAELRQRLHDLRQEAINRSIDMKAEEAYVVVRGITDHKISELNRRAISVVTRDAVDLDGANHRYRIEAFEKIPDGYGEFTVDVKESVEIKFQQGGLAEVGVNGISDQALLAVVLDRLRGFQQGPFSSRENALAITKLEECLLWMGKRYADRAARGVEGKREK